MRSRTWRIWLGSRPMVGSSRMRSSGSWIDGIGQADALPIALGKKADELALDVLQGAEIEHVVEAFLDAAAGDALQGGAKAEVLMDAHVLRQGNVFRHVADVLTSAEGVLKNVVSGHLGPAGGRG